jgi:uncharacterized protein YdeI (YjbR/CyaY-like superfamily)
MTQEPILHFETRAEWRAWLEHNFNTQPAAWLVSAKKASGKHRIVYNDAVEEALCFGWIDSTVKTLDEEHTMQRFTPRNPKSSFSQPNIERLKWLSDNGLIHSSVLGKVQAVIAQSFVFPQDILVALQKDKATWDNYVKFSESYKRIRVAYIDGARKRPEEFAKRLANFIEKTRDNKLIAGFGGIDKYYT